MKYVFAKDAGPDDWVALPRVFKKGEVIHRYDGHDYGCARDDLMYGGVSTISCSIDGNTPFFTVPVEMLLTEQGDKVKGDYMVIK